MIGSIFYYIIQFFIGGIIIGGTYFASIFSTMIICDKNKQRVWNFFNNSYIHRNYIIVNEHEFDNIMIHLTRTILFTILSYMLLYEMKLSSVAFFGFIFYLIYMSINAREIQGKISVTYNK
jgi:hypothetical protein